MLATNHEQWQQIARLFEQYYPETGTAPPEPASSNTPLHRPTTPSALPSDSSTPSTSVSPQARWSPRALLGQVRQRLRTAPRWLLYGLLVSSLSLGLAMLLAPLLQPPPLTQETPAPAPAAPPVATSETQEH